jgi:hypothetical protein
MKTCVLVFAALALTACGKLPVFDLGDLAMADGGPRSFSALYSGYLSSCASCHAPGAAGRPANIEQTLDFTTRATAFQTLSGQASGMSGDPGRCNGVSFLTAGDAGTSLAFAVLDPTTRGTPTVPGTFANGACSNSSSDDMSLGPTVTDEAAKTSMQMPSQFLIDFGAWIVQGASNN